MHDKSKGGIASLADQALVSGSNFLMVFLCVQFMHVEEMGKVGLVVAANFATVMIGLTAIFQLASVEYVRATDLRSYVSAHVIYQLFLAIFAGILITSLIFVVAVYSGWTPSMAETGLLALFLIIQQLADFDRRISYIAKGPKRALASSAFLHMSRILALVLVRPDTVSLVLVILIASCLVPALITIGRALRDISIWADARHFALTRVFRARWLISSGGLSWLWGHTTIFFAGYVLGLESVGILVTVRSIANVANIGIETLETYGAVVLAKLNHSSAEGYRGANKYLLLIGGALWLAGLVVLGIIGEPLVKVLFGPDYATYWGLLAYFWTVSFAIFVFKLGCIDLRIHGQLKMIFFAYLAGVVTCAVLSPVGLHLMGLHGGLLAYLLSAGVLCVFAYFFGSKMRGTSEPSIV